MDNLSIKDDFNTEAIHSTKTHIPQLISEKRWSLDYKQKYHSRMQNQLLQNNSTSMY